MARRLYVLAALMVASFLLNDIAQACTCVEGYIINKRARERAERERMQDVWKWADTIVLVSTVTVGPSDKPDIPRATLLVVRAWKGPYKEGDKIEPYLGELGDSMCDLPVPDFNPFLLYFQGKAEINGCPSQFVVTPIKFRELDRLKAKEEKAAKKRS